MARLNQYGIQSEDGVRPALEPTLGAMTDASKRHRDFEEELWSETECDGSGWAVPTLPSPEPRSSADQLPMKPSQGKLKLPPGIESVEEWGKTICELPSVVSLKKSYEELTLDSNQKGYLTWVIQHETGMGPRVEDLAKYLKAIQYDVKHDLGKSSGATFPGTTIVRKFK
eukprot:s4146_g3.t1